MAHNQTMFDASLNSCKACTAPDNAEMVQCDNHECDGWYHFSCVGVTSAIQQLPWMCETCKQNKLRQDQSQPGPSKPVLNAKSIVQKTSKALSVVKSNFSGTSSERRRKLELLRLEEERKLQDARDQEERTLREIRDKEQRSRDKEERAEKARRDKEYLDKKYCLLDQDSEYTSENDSQSEDFIGKTKRWLDQTANSLKNVTFTEPQYEPTARNSMIPAASVNSMCPMQAGTQRPFQMPPAEHSGQRRDGLVRERGNPASDGSSSSLSRDEQPVRLTTNHIAARHVSKDLPYFSGSPEEWPLFISCYNTSTENCGFSNSENMIRLQRCLKGRALDSVRSKLLLPSMVPDIISTLKMLYGRPDLIIHTMLQKVRAEPPPKADKFETIIAFAISVQNLCATMEASGLEDHLCNPSLIQELTDKLPSQIKLNWAIYKQTVSTVTLTTLGQWLYQLAAAVSEVTIPTFSSHASETRVERRSQAERGFLQVHSEESVKSSSRSFTGQSSSGHRPVKSTEKCVACDRKCSRIADCDQFKSWSPSARWNCVKENRLCKRCFGPHNHFRCRSSALCGTNGCTFKHHPLLHNEQSAKPVETQPVASSSACHTHHASTRKVLFRIVPVKLHSEKGSVDTFAFLDEGSELNLLEAGLADELGLAGTQENLCLRWTANAVRVEKNSRRVSVDISGTTDSSKRFHLSDVRTVESLNLPIQTMISTDLVERYPHLSDLPLEDYVDAVPRLIIGMMNSNLGLALEYREGSTNEPVATRTRLGWIVHGVNGQVGDKRETFSSYHICECSKDNELHSMMKDYFSTESFGVKVPESDPKSKDDRRADEILEVTTKKGSERFETGLIWKYDKFDLPDSMPMARRRLESLERKMRSNQDYAEQMKIRIREYELKGYARKLSTEELRVHSPRIWYLPVFTVTNDNKPGKFRMVFDAAAKVDGICLNTVLLKGPDQLEPLPAVLHRFRERRIGISGDIREMFHQIRIRKEDQDSQRFLWRDGDSMREPDVYVMQVMTFGATCSPSSAQYVKNRNAKEWSNSCPRAVAAITRNHYVDDWLDSVDTVGEAVKLAEDVKFIHAKAGFEIRNFISNSSQVLQSLSKTPEDNAVKDLNIAFEREIEKVLGMWWNTETDSFTYSLRYNKSNKDVLTGNRAPTKREVLRTLMSIFDPLGMLSFFLVYVKILLQDIWRSGIGWDQSIEPEQNKRWLSWIKVLPTVETLHIPRCYSGVLSSNSQKSTQLHIFVDASEKAFAALAYLRVESEEGATCSLAGAKNRVAPQKPLSVPRLELQAAVLGTRLASSICETHSVKIDKRFFWSDSKTVLYWLRSDPSKYRQFVAFRLGEILDSTKVEEWRWVPTKQNVADEATKWNRTPEFSSSSRWFTGPEFLQHSEDHWPTDIFENDGPITEEVKPHFVHSAPLAASSFDWSRFSRWTLLVRAQAVVLRFVHNLRKKNKSVQKKGPFSSEEISAAENQLFRVAQVEAYPEEVMCLENSKNVAKSSRIYNRSPYLDSENVMRMRGRIDAAVRITKTMKRPIILPKDHPVTHLLVAHVHRSFHHMYPETVVNELQQKYTIPKIRVLLKSVVRKCQRCKNQRARPTPPEMSDLPPARLASFTRPFSFIGIDYFGPITVSIGRRSEKRWGVLITCLTIRAIHIEVAHTLSTDSCIMAIRNFIARRGTPIEIYSDNGTNFHGADNELRKELKNVDQSCLQQKFTSASTKWIFNCPASPHMGGSWERLIRSVKKSLKQINPSRNPSDELLRSLLCEVENIVNSRPLTFVALESREHEALTPNHFLLGSSSGLKPPGCFSSDAKLLARHWKTSQQLASFFWKRWVREYLPTITRRTKWFESVKNIEKGDVVIIVDENNPANCWPKGIVIDTIVGKNDQVRQAVVKTSSGIFTRPAVKIAVLDVLRPESKVNSSCDESTGR